MYYLYVLYNEKSRLFTVGVTKDLNRRKKIICLPEGMCRIVHYEIYETDREATLRENELKHIRQEVLEEWVREMNPLLVDLSEDNFQNL
jgi:predicted GIY-YIG superfamily endonuclease